MGTFKDTDQLIAVIGGFIQKLASTPEIAQKMLASNLVFRLVYKDPEAVIVVDCLGDEARVRPGDTETEAAIELSMGADIAHKFWFGKVNLTMALTRRKMIAKGPIQKILKLLPVIKPAYAMYPKYLEENGFSEFNIY
ncbi:MAG: SCP2 sterol-binding domain-containing protein [Deltaproteobacteria bacterium]|nr:SCP2 sterol-binding domain-containing protein [Deltaproteobacteria bacterium]